MVTLLRRVWALEKKNDADRQNMQTGTHTDN